MKYPYIPKSNRKLEVGEFWSIPLPNKEFACGIVLEIPNKAKKRVIFLAGLLHWIGKEPPNETNILKNATNIYKYGYAHVKTITAIDATILGKITLVLEDDFLPTNRDKIRTWGYNVINLRAQDLQKESS